MRSFDRPHGLKCELSAAIAAQMIGDEGNCLRELVDLLLGATGNMLNPPAPLGRLSARIIRDYYSQEERLDPSRCHKFPLCTALVTCAEALPFVTWAQYMGQKLPARYQRGDRG
ncbi:hypothetical protein K2Z83_00175 [Oscillochloris sp. ZM17-4]|uniref:hypothetical protein n=1 Tax=Oscillochloris sp. ZM17-4 TaxID=2866714 RepID=UPI001C733F74|nr:hypothetical protein [Oscillochloris sp. ZM17-4]MBX0326109.1 hypothetical protein [Oscillochloris sp. ZM17-4]